MPEECITPQNQTGYCVEIKNCPTLYNLLNNSSAREFLRSSKCEVDSEDISNPLVCCKKSGNSNNSAISKGSNHRSSSKRSKNIGNKIGKYEKPVNVNCSYLKLVHS